MNNPARLDLGLGWNPECSTSIRSRTHSPEPYGKPGTTGTATDGGGSPHARTDGSRFPEQREASR